jgi:hypothetical protein
MEQESQVIDAAYVHLRKHLILADDRRVMGKLQRLLTSWLDLEFPTVTVLTVSGCLARCVVSFFSLVLSVILMIIQSTF